MEDLQTLSIESFSYRCSMHEAHDGSFRAYLESSNEASSLKKISSSNRLNGNAQDFNFPTTRLHLDLAHADDLFSNGLLTPRFLDDASLSAQSSSSPVFADSVIQISSSCNPKRREGCCKSWVRFLSRLHPWTYCGNNGGTISKSMARSEQMSPRTGGVYCCGDRSESENSIYEAVIYCKQSWENK